MHLWFALRSIDKKGMSLQDLALGVVDSLVARAPSTVPSKAALEGCKIISHRGENDNVEVKENTLAAFARARDAGVWGIECDIRWTSDQVPVIHHDPTPQRLFGAGTPISELPFAQLRREFPLIPTLEEIIAEFGGNTHLMLELKAETWPEPKRQRETLQSLLARFNPTGDFHILALHPEQFERVAFLPAACFLPVAETNVVRLSRYAMETGCAGLAGHYLLLHARMQQRHQAAGQRIGTGFPDSKSCLFRELNRGVDWIFSNRAVKLQAIRDKYLNATEHST